MIDDFRGEYAFLSNFWPSPIVALNILFPTVEHAFQASKSTIPTRWFEIQDCATPRLAKQFGRRLKLRSDWEEVKVDVMRELLYKKFEEPYLQAKLLLTVDEELVEGNWWGDTFWGVCNGIGENNLGKLLMKVRHDLKDNDSYFLSNL